MNVQGNSQNNLYSLIPLEDFKALLGVDDREDKTSRFCLVTATFTIEQYCKRRFIKKRHIDYHTYTGDHIFTLREYPLRKIVSVHAAREEEAITGQNFFEQKNLVSPEYYYWLPEMGVNEDLPFSLVIRPPLRYSPGKILFRVRYLAGYDVGKAPPDLASACLELAAWNMNRYRGRRIGMTGNVRGGGKDGEHFEMSMPENVRGLLEPYKRRVI